jgi:hypothetical protein
MKELPNGLERFATGIGVGSIIVLGAFMFIDVGFKGFFLLFEKYASSNAFSVIVAIPTVAFLYVIGSSVMVVSDVFFNLGNKEGFLKEREHLIYLVKENNETLNVLFMEIFRRKKALEASVIPLIIFGLGVALESINHVEHWFPLCSIGGVIVLFSMALPFINSKMSKELEEVIDGHRNAINSELPTSGSNRK